MGPLQDERELLRSPEIGPMKILANGAENQTPRQLNLASMGRIIGIYARFARIYVHKPVFLTMLFQPKKVP